MPLKTSQHGFTMLEVLITIVVIAGALLGTAGMQAYGLKLTQGSQFRTQAVVLANNLLERIEANNDAAKAGQYETTLGGGAAAHDNPGCTAGCEFGDLADYDLSQFEIQLLNELPNASATVALDPATPALGAGPWTYVVTVSWKEVKYRPKGTTSATGGEADVETFTYSIRRTVYDRSSVL